jgi:cell division protein FtsL
MSEKHDILEETQPIIVPDESMGPLFLRNVFIGVFLILMIVFPKIFIQTQIYFKSREISTLNREHDALQEENRIIRAKVEHMVYKNKILDTLF